jgi:hypothetical protein
LTQQDKPSTTTNHAGAPTRPERRGPRPCSSQISAAIVDRLTVAGQIIETGTTSYRLAHAREVNEPRRVLTESGGELGAAQVQLAGDLEIRAAGFEPVRVGGLDQSIRIEMYGDLHEFGGLGRPVTRSEALAAV